MIYHPNFKDPRVIRRVRTALGFAKAMFSPTTTREWSTTKIDQYFGQQQLQSSKFLRNVLLITTDQSWSKDTGKCKGYKLNLIGYQFLKDAIQGKTELNWNQYYNQHKGRETLLYSFSNSPSERQYDATLVRDTVLSECKRELTTKKFKYNDSNTGRLFHPLQWVKREYKADILADYDLIHQYDISTSAPTLLHQYAQQQSDPMDLYLFALRDYLKNRASIREQIADDLGISEKSAKTLINSLFCGANIGHVAEYESSELLKHDYKRIEAAKNHPFLIGLREDIKVLWQYIEPSTVIKYNTLKNGKQRKVPMSYKTKWGVYFMLERKVLNAIKLYLDKQNNQCFLEHDGWACTREVDIREMEKHIFDTTGFEVNIEYSLL